METLKQSVLLGAATVASGLKSAAASSHREFHKNMIPSYCRQSPASAQPRLLRFWFASAKRMTPNTITQVRGTQGLGRNQCVAVLFELDSYCHRDYWSAGGRTLDLLRWIYCCANR
eukprot:m.56867 g.56867  ORF g.56867 m.56867 type:complete len:116 (-) comp18812_c0_seq2:420-767(-)